MCAAAARSGRGNAFPPRRVHPDGSANEEGGAAHASTPAWVFGLFAFGALVAALIVTMMIKVGD